MIFTPVYFQALALIIALMTLLWLVSIRLKNVSIVDQFWGLGFVIAGCFYFFSAGESGLRNKILLTLLVLWGLRLSAYLSWRNYGKGEDFRYRNFRSQYGDHRYWWISYFQTFLLQGILMWLISAPLLGAQSGGGQQGLWLADYLGIGFWGIGFIFEAGGDIQLARFKKDEQNKGKVLNTGFWKYTRHPNYFGDAAVWWGYGFFSIAAGNYWNIAGSVIMTLLIIKVSGVALLEKTLQVNKPGYDEYVRKTSAFLPWFPKK
jgi:steroid 5-alpha reductase family enzyme